MTSNELLELDYQNKAWPDYVLGIVDGITFTAKDAVNKYPNVNYIIRTEDLTKTNRYNESVVYAKTVTHKGNGGNARQIPPNHFVFKWKGKVPAFSMSLECYFDDEIDKSNGLVKEPLFDLKPLSEDEILSIIGLVVPAFEHLPRYAPCDNCSLSDLVSMIRRWHDTEIRKANGEDKTFMDLTLSRIQDKYKVWDRKHYTDVCTVLYICSNFKEWVYGSRVNEMAIIQIPDGLAPRVILKLKENDNGEEAITCK